VSRFTTVLLSVGSEEDEYLIAPVNDALRDEADWDDWTLCPLGASFGGPKVPPALYGGTVKYFDFAAFARILCEMTWRDRDTVQVMIYDENDFRWGLFSLTDLQASAGAQ
jgi:hypothetical protein